MYKDEIKVKSHLVRGGMGDAPGVTPAILALFVDVLSCLAHFTLCSLVFRASPILYLTILPLWSF